MEKETMRIGAEMLTRWGAKEPHWAEAARFPALCLARVTAQYGRQYRLITQEGECLAQVSGRLQHEAAASPEYPAVGDFVLAAAQKGAPAVVHRVLARSSAFSRPAVGGAEPQIVAANVDTVFVCMSLDSKYSLNRLERYLAVAWNSGAAPVVLLTKADLCGDESGACRQAAQAAPGVEIAVAGAKQDVCTGLAAWLQPGCTAVFVGPSGVGKSTLVNRLARQAVLATGPVRADGRGRHTTTRRQLFLLPCGGLVIDTPGLRELGAQEADLPRAFADVEALARHCRFFDCTHTAEPGCAVRQAIASGELAPRRLASYQKLEREAACAGLNARSRETEKWNTLLRDVGGVKKVRKYIRQNSRRTGE